jgi:hypothetical protein
MRSCVQFCTDLYRTARRKPSGWVLVAIALVLTGCSDDGKTAAPPTTTPPIPEVGFLPPGTPLADGLVVPKGARLVGRVFPHPADDDPNQRDYTALLDVGDNPFMPWDDLADQMRAKGAPFPHSGSCTWASSPGYPSGPVTEPRPSGSRAMNCETGAGGPLIEGRGMYLQARLWWAAKDAELALLISDRDESMLTRFPDADLGPAPTSALAQLPPRHDAPLPTVGQRLGFANDALEGSLYLRVPPASRVIGGGQTPSIEDFEAVLAVGDAHAVLTSLAHQVDANGPKIGSADVHLERTELADGSSAWALRSLINDGGGSTEMLSSPGGKAVLVTTRSD